MQAGSVCSVEEALRLYLAAERLDGVFNHATKQVHAPAVTDHVP